MESPPQLLNSGSDNFKSKLRNIYDKLAIAEKDVNLPKDIPMEIEVDPSKRKSRARKNRKKTKAMKGQESLFKKPGLHKVGSSRPSRATRLYSLGIHEMTDVSITASTLQTLERQLDESKGPFSNELLPVSGTCRYTDSKRIMPEHVVGEKMVKTKKITPKPKRNEKELNLSHLHEIEDGE